MLNVKVRKNCGKKNSPSVHSHQGNFPIYEALASTTVYVILSYLTHIPVFHHFTPVSKNHVQCFPGGSGFSCREDMPVLWVSAICLRRRAILKLVAKFAFGWFQKVRKHFLRKVFRVCGHFMCLTYPELFFKGTSAGCFETSQTFETTQISPFSPCPTTSYCETQKGQTYAFLHARKSGKPPWEAAEWFKKRA